MLTSFNFHNFSSFSKFQYASMAQVPFPAKKTFQNTQRSVLEHRMEILNEFLRIVCNQCHENDDLHTILRDFLEPDTNDKKISGGSVIRTVIASTTSSHISFQADFNQFYSSLTIDRNDCESIQIWHENDQKYARYTCGRYVIINRQCVCVCVLRNFIDSFQAWRKSYWGGAQARSQHSYRTHQFSWIILPNIPH